MVLALLIGAGFLAKPVWWQLRDYCAARFARQAGTAMQGKNWPVSVVGLPTATSVESTAVRRVKRCLGHAPADRLVFAADCGLSQTARWAAKRKLAAMCGGVRVLRNELGLA